MKKTKKIWFQMSAALAVAWVASCGFAATTVKIISSAMRESDPTIMDVEYCVKSDSAKVDTRALAFQDGVRSFANVVRPETFLDGSVIGDGVAANVTNKFSWRVSADWKIDLAKVSIEVLAKKPGEGLVPLHWVTISKTEDSVEVSISTTDLTDAQALDALYWLYADKDETLVLTDGVLSDKNGTLVNGTEVFESSGNDYCANAGRHIYEKMGYESLTLDTPYMAAYASIVRRKTMSSSYGYVCNKVDATAEQKMGNGLYMVVNLDVLPFKVTYLDAAPAGGWNSDKYKTSKLVLRRIDSTNGVYYAGVFEVTEAQWYRVMGEDLGDRWYYWDRNGIEMSTSTLPITASWISIRGETYVNVYSSNKVLTNSFMGVLRLMTGLQTFDLPNVAEWSAAAGSLPSPLTDYVWYEANSDYETHAVGTKLPNALGLYDVYGNLAEWCLDKCEDMNARTVKGGSWRDDAEYLTRSKMVSPNGLFSGFRVFCRAEGK